VRSSSSRSSQWPRSSSARRAAAAALAGLAGLAGCGDEQAAPGEPTLAIYVSAPLSGPARAEGRALADGARLALAEAGGEAAGVRVVARFLDVAGRDESRFDPFTAAANAREASRDSQAIGYVGELDSGASRTSAPILNEAGIPQLAPGSGAEDLVRAEPFNDDVPREVQPTGARTFAMLAPTYPAGGEQRLLSAARIRATPAGEELARAYERRWDRPFTPPAAYGYEAMAALLAAIERAEDPLDRAAVTDALFDGTERDSPLGRYRITTTGELAPVP
jgi:ABC-type branched-subunit amino acid transport system substrate-binding protein